MKRHASTFIFFVLALGLAIYVWHDRNTVTTGESENRKGDVFPAWRREDLTRIEIAHENETIVLTRDPKMDQWSIVAPREERADHAAVERLATTLEFATRVRKVAKDDPLGFDKPRARGTVTMGALVFAFTLGAESPRPQGSGYLKVDNGDPFVASSELTNALLAGVDTYRDRTVIPYLSTEMARFEVVRPGGGFVVERHDARSFDIPALHLLASRTSLDKVWSALAEMRAEAFPKDADADRLTANPKLTIKILPSDKSKPGGSLVVGDPCPGHPEDVVVLRTAPTRVAACAPKGAMDALAEITAELLVDKKAFGFRHDEIEEIKLEGGKDAKPIELARMGTGFHLRSPEDRSLTTDEADAANENLVAIEKAEAADVKAGGAPFTAESTAHIWAGDFDEVVELASDGVTVRRVRDDARLTFTKEQFRRLMPRTTWTKALVMLGETRKVTRVLLACGAEQELVDSGEGLKLVKPGNYVADGSITQLVDAITRGKVVGWTADRDDGTFGLSPKGCRVVLSFADGNNPVTLLLGNDAEDGVYGRLEDRPEVFVAPGWLTTMAKRLYVNTAALRVEAGRIESVTVTAKDKVAETNPSALASAVSLLLAKRVVAFGSDLGGPVDLEIVIKVAEVGAPKVVRCAGTHCLTPDVNAVFEVAQTDLDAFTIPRNSGPIDAGVVDAR